MKDTINCKYKWLPGTSELDAKHLLHRTCHFICTRNNGLRRMIWELLELSDSSLTVNDTFGATGWSYWRLPRTDVGTSGSSWMRFPLGHRDPFKFVVFAWSFCYRSATELQTFQDTQYYTTRDALKQQHPFPVGFEFTLLRKKWLHGSGDMLLIKRA